VTHDLPRRRLHRAGATQRRERSVVAQPVRVVTGSDQQRRSRLGTDTRQCEQRRRSGGDEYRDLSVECCDLRVERLEPPRDRGEGEPRSPFRRVRPAGTEPCRARHEVTAPQPAQTIAHRVRRVHQRAVEDVHRLRPRLHRRPSREPQHPQALDRARCRLGRAGRLTHEHRASCFLRVDRVRLAAPPPSLPVRPTHLDDDDSGRLEVARKAGSPRPGPLDSDRRHVTERREPRSQLAIPATRRRELGVAEMPAQLVERRGDMDILVGVHAADDPDTLRSTAQPCSFHFTTKDGTSARQRDKTLARRRGTRFSEVTATRASAPVRRPRPPADGSPSGRPPCSARSARVRVRPADEAAAVILAPATPPARKRRRDTHSAQCKGVLRSRQLRCRERVEQTGQRPDRWAREARLGSWDELLARRASRCGRSRDDCGASNAPQSGSHPPRGPTGRVSSAAFPVAPRPARAAG